MYTNYSASSASPSSEIYSVPTLHSSSTSSQDSTLKATASTVGSTSSAQSSSAESSLRSTAKSEGWNVSSILSNSRLPSSSTGLESLLSSTTVPPPSQAIDNLHDSTSKNVSQSYSSKSWENDGAVQTNPSRSPNHTLAIIGTSSMRGSENASMTRGTTGRGSSATAYNGNDGTAYSGPISRAGAMGWLPSQHSSTSGRGVKANLTSPTRTLKASGIMGSIQASAFGASLSPSPKSINSTIGSSMQVSTPHNITGGPVVAISAPTGFLSTKNGIASWSMQISIPHNMTVGPTIAIPSASAIYSPSNHSTAANRTLKNESSRNSTSNNLTPTGPVMHGSISPNRTLANTTSWKWTTANNSAPSAGLPFNTALNGSMRSRPTTRFTNSTSKQQNACSSTLTTNPFITTTIYTITVEMDQMITLAANASLPPPVIISPPSACATTTNLYNPNWGPGKDHNPNTQSVLLVTKKNPVAISPETVGPLFNVPTTTSQPPVAQPAESAQPETPDSGNNSDSSDGHQSSNGNDNHSQEPATSDGNAQPQAVGNKPDQDSGRGAANTESPSASSEDHTAGSAKLNQELPEPALKSTNSGQSNDGGSEPGSGAGQDSGGDGGASNNDQGSAEDRQTASTGQNTADGGGANGQGPSASGDQSSGGGQASKEGGSTPSNGQGSGDNNQIPGGTSPPAVGHKPGAGAGEASSSGVGGQASPDGDQSNSGSTGSQEASQQSGSGSQSVDNGTGNPSTINQTPNSGTSQEGSPADGNSDIQGSPNGENANSGGYVPTAATVDGVPIAVANSAVAVGSHTVSAGSPPTTFVENGQTFSIEPSQIIGPHTTIPIQAAITPPPQSSTNIGGVPVVLQPNKVIIGSQTFTHGSTAAFAVYNGQTYSWDAKQLVGPSGNIVAFPSSTPTIPRVTAGGQIFSVYPSYLKASGSDINLPNSPSASPFVINDRTFSVNPSQLIAPGSSITIPPATQPTPFVYKSQTFSVDNSRFIAPSATIPITSGSGTVRYGTEVITISHTQIVCPDTTIALSGNAPLETSVGLSAITTGGVTFSIGPSAAVLGSSTYSFLPGQVAATNTDLGQPITIDHGGVKFGTVAVAVPTTPTSYSAVTQNGITLSLAPSNIVLDGKTQDISSNMVPITTAIQGQSISIGANGVAFPSTTIPLPTSTGYSVVTQGGLTLSLAASNVILNGETQSIQPTMVPITTTVDGKTVSIGPQGIEIPGITIPLPTPSPSYAVVSQNGITISVAPTAAVIHGSTFAIGPDTPATMVVDGQTISVGPSEINFPGTTISLPTRTSQEAPARVTADGLTFSVGPSDAFIDGTAYAIGNGAMSKTISVGSEMVVLGSDGVVLPTTTIAPQQTPTAVATADGVTISADATEAIINGTTYAIGNNAIAKTVTIGSDTIGLGTKGIILPSSTIAPWSNGSLTGSPIVGTNGASIAPSSVQALAATGNSPPTGLPSTGPGGEKDNVRQGAGSLARPLDMVSWSIVLGLLLIGLVTL